MDVVHDVCALADWNTMSDWYGLTLLSSELYPGLCALSSISEINVPVKVRATQTCTSFDQFAHYFNRESCLALHINGLTATCHGS